MGMAGQLKRMDVVSNNLANAGTSGFKRDVVITQSFSDVLMRRVRDYNMRGFNTTTALGPASLGLIINSIHRDFSAGSLQPTGGPLDLALEGVGFFQIMIQSGEEEPVFMFTRDGSFTLNEEGTLVTSGGHTVLSASGNPITIPGGDILITDTGHIMVNGTLVDNIGIFSFEDTAELRPFGENFYTITEEAEIIPFAGRVIQGYVETSNVNSVREMVEMISLSRAYEANSRMVQIADQTLGQAVNEIARP